MLKHKVFFAALILFGGCARRKSIIDDFQPKKLVTPLNRLALASVRWSRIQRKSPHTVEITWAACHGSQSLVGYALYRWIPNFFIKKTPLHVSLPSENMYIDSTISDSAEYCYLVRGIFEINGHRVEGPGSPIAFCPLYKK